MSGPLNAKNIADAYKKLNELVPLLGVEDANERYKQYLPSNFYMGIVFFELPQREQGKLQLLNKLMSTTFSRGFFGGIVLSADGLDLRNTAHFRHLSGDMPMHFVKIDGRTLVSTDGFMWSGSIEKSPNVHSYCLFGWTQQHFAIFAFDLIAVMNGTYDPGVGSSWHGLTFSVPSS